MAQGDWTTVRVSLDTLEMLQDVRAAMMADQTRAADPLGTEYTQSGEPSKRDEIGLDQVIRRLIYDRRRWQGRKRRSRRRPDVQARPPDAAN